MITKNGNVGEEICIAITISNFKNINTAQFSINYNPTVVQAFEIRNITTQLLFFNINNIIIDQNKKAIRVSWDDANTVGQDLPDNTVLFEICFKLIGPPGSCSPVILFDKPIVIEFTDSLGNILCVRDKDPTDQIKIQLPTNLYVHSSVCGSQNNRGSITITTWGGMGPYTLMFTNPPLNDVLPNSGDSKTYNNLAPGNYTVKITDATGKDTTLNLTVSFSPSIDIQVDRSPILGARNPRCWNTLDGVVSAVITGGTGPLIYGWTPLNVYGVTRVTFLGIGMYTINVQDSLGCTASLDFNLFADSIVANVTVEKDATCAGDDGVVFAKGTGGNPFPGNRYEYFWSFNPAANCLPDTACRNMAISGSQFVIVKDSRMCADTVYFDVPNSGFLADSVTVTPVRCFGELSGGFTVKVLAPGSVNLPITVNTFNNQTNMPIPGGIVNGIDYTSPGLGVGTYRVEITDNAGCVLFDTISIKGPPLLEIIENTFDSTESCNPSQDAIIDIRGFGGTGSYSFRWDYMNSSSSQLFGLSAGTYTVTLTDANNCQVIKSYTITKPNPPTIIGFNNLNVNCPGEQTGCVEVRFNLGSAAINTILWNTNDNAQRVCNLRDGQYSVTITDDNGCTATDTTSIQAVGFGVRIDSVILFDPKCPGFSDGTILIFPKGGSPPYTYILNGVPASNLNTNLPAGRYILQLDDVGGCPMVIDTFFLNDPPRPQGNLVSTAGPKCSGSLCDGQAIINIAGLDPSYTITWSSGERTIAKQDTANQLCEGAQFVIISYLNNCSDTIPFNLVAPPPILIDPSFLQITNPRCYGSTDGQISLAATGGIGPYQYLWADMRMGPTIGNLADGTYYVNIIDANNCVHLDSIRVRQPDSIRVDIIPGSTLDVSCAGRTDGRIVTVWSGGNGGLGSFQWTPNVGSDSVLVNLAAGTYTLIVSDKNNCTGVISYTVKAPPPLNAFYSVIDTPFCDGDQIQFGVINANGGAGPMYRYTINNGAPNSIGQTVPLFSGNYTIRIFDANGCFIDTSIVIPNPFNVLSLAFLRKQETIQLGDSVQLEGRLNSLSVIDSIIWTPVSFVSDPSNTISFVSPPQTTMYVLTVIDENGCTASDMVTVNVESSRKFYVPNLFSPNEDGINDFLSLHVGPGVVEVAYVSVYDRWGDQVYFLEKPDISAGTVFTWDGTAKGEKLNPGVFVYAISVKFKDGFTYIYRGDITLLK